MSWFSQELFERERIERHVTWGRPVRALEKTTSTNDEALSAITGDALTGIVWIAREQTKGRGRRGNSWTARPGDCLMLSTLLRHAGPPERMLGLSLVVGLAVRDAIAELFEREGIEKEPKVKWPNDVLVSGKKLAGVLIETRFDPNGNLGVVIGLGLNLQATAFPEELKNATSLRLLGADPAALSSEKLLASFLSALEKRVSKFLVGGVGAFVKELNIHDALNEESVRVGDITGVGAGMDEGGRLLLRTPGGQVVPIESGHVELLDGDP